jgi:hypothetical protein
MALTIKGAQENGNGLIELQVDANGGVSAPVAADGRDVAPAPAPETGGGGGPGGVSAKLGYTTGTLKAIDVPLPACKVTALRVKWSSVPSGAVLAVWLEKNDGGQNGLINTSGASNTTVEDAGGLPVTFADNDTLTVYVQEDESGNPASGAVISVFVDIEAP